MASALFGGSSRSSGSEGRPGVLPDAESSRQLPSRAGSRSNNVSFLSNTPIEEFVAKYQVIKVSWRGKYERIFALAPTRFCTIDPRDFEVTNTWSLTALISIALDAGDAQGFVLTLKGAKKDEQLKLRCRFRARLLSDLYRLRDQYQQRNVRPETGFQCTKWSRRNEMLSCVLQVGMDGVTCSQPGVVRSKYLYTEMEHLTLLADSQEAFAIGYTGRSRLFYSQQRGQIFHRIQAAAEAIGCVIKTLSSVTAEKVQEERTWYGLNHGDPFVQFHVRKRTPKYNEPRDRVISLYDNVLVELDREDKVVACYNYSDIYVLVRDPSNADKFEIQFRNDQVRQYLCKDRDGVLSAIFDICVTCEENPEVFISCVVNQRGLRLLPFSAVEDTTETQSFFNDSSIGSWYLQRMASVGKFGSSIKMGDRGFVEIVAEFNANVPASGIPYSTKHSTITEALRPMCAQLYYVAKSSPVPTRSAVTLIQALFRISSSYYGFREIGEAGQISETITNLLNNGDEFVVFWTTLLLRKLTAHVAPTTASVDKTSLKYCEEVETQNKKVFFANTYLTQSLLTHLEEIDVDPSASGDKHTASPLVMMGLLQTLEGCLCSRAATTGATEFMTLVEGVAKFYNTLLKVLFQSRCATTVEACTLLLKTTLEECDPVVASDIRDKALTEGIVLRHFYQGLFDESFDQRCVSRYLVALWMSHHDGSKQLLGRLIPPGFFRLLKEPPGTPAQVEDYDRLEREAMEIERQERLQEFNDDDDRASSISASTMQGSSIDWPSGSDTGTLGGSDVSQEKLTRKSVSMGNIGPNSAGLSESRRLSASNLPISEVRSSFSGERSSLSWKGAGGQSSLEGPIENNNSKARMLRKLKSSVDGASTNSRAGNRLNFDSHNGKSKEVQPRLRKRDVAMSFITGTLSGSKRTHSHNGHKSSRGKHIAMARSHRAQENFRLLFHMLSLDHENFDMIWNKQTREELRQALSAEMKRFTRFQIHSGGMQARWNYEDFEVYYPSLANEIVVGGLYIRILAHLRSKMSFFGTVTEEDEFVALTPEQVPIQNPAAVLAALYVRMLRENIHAEYRDDLNASILCIKSMGVVAAAHAGYVNAVNFEETGHLLTLMGETVHTSMLENFLHTVRALCLHPGNARRILSSEHNLDLVVQLLQLVHSTDRDIGDITEPKRLWSLETNEGEQLGTFSINELKQKRDEEHTDMSTVWVKRQDDPACEPLATKGKVMEIAQLRWEVGILGGLHPRQTAHDAASILLSVARSNSLLGDSSTHNGDSVSPIYPPPRGKTTLWSYTRRILPVLARSEHPKLWEKISSLLEFLYTGRQFIDESYEKDITNTEYLYCWGLFYLAFMGDTADFKSMAGLLKSTHRFQNGFNEISALTDILPQAMINLLEASTPSAFTKVFCDGDYSPQVIWSGDMRKHLHDQCVAHLKDYIQVLEEDASREWRFCPMAPVMYKELSEEVWCGEVYLGQFCEQQNFTISEPLAFMKKLTETWRSEANREESSLDYVESCQILGVAQDSSNALISDSVLRASFKEKGRALVEASPIDYNERLQELEKAYRVLTCPRPTLLTAGHDPVNLLLVLHSLVIMCNRYPEELAEYEFDSYDLLLPLLASHCSAEGVVPEGTTKEQALEISVCAAELVYNTCAVSMKNGDVLLDQTDLGVLEKVVNYCVDAMVGCDAAENPELLEVCFFLFQTITGLLAAQRGREWISKSSTLLVDMVRVLWVWNQAEVKSFFLSKIAQQSLEGISRMAQLPDNQERLVHAGVLWQLFMLFSTYDMELDDVTVRNRLQNSMTSVEESYADVAQEVQNLLAIMAVRALCRLGGFFAEGSELQTSPNVLVKRVVDAMMTPNLSNLLLLSSHHEFLKIYHGDCESYTLFWNSEMRQEQLAFLSPRASVEPTVSSAENYSEAIKFRYMYLADLFYLGELYIEMLMGSLLVIEKSLVPAPVSELGLTEKFFHELFSFIDSGELVCPEYEDEDGNVQKYPPYAGWDVDSEQLATMDRVTALNCLSITATVAPTLVEKNLVADDSAMKMVLRLLFPPDNEVHQSEDAEKSLVLTPQLYPPCRLHCLATLKVLSTLDDFGRASLEFGICDILIELVHLCQNVGPDVLEIIRNLCAHGAAAECVSEILQSGCYLELIGWVLLVEETIVDDEFDAAESLRVPSALVLSEMVKDKAPLYIESRRALCRFFPPAIVRAIASSPETIVEYIMADHMTPELVWNVEFRNHQRNNIVNFLNIYFSATSTTETEDGKFTSVVDSFEIDYTGLYSAPMAGNVYLTLYMEDPTFNLHDPLYFMTCLWSEFEALFRQLAHMTSALRATMAPADDELVQRDIDLIDLVGSAIVCLLQVETQLLKDAAELHIPSKCCDFLNETVRSQACEPCVVNAVRILRVCTLSRVCIESMQQMCSTALSCLMALINPVRGGPLHFESAHVLEIMRRIVLEYPEHGDRDASAGIVYVASRLDLFGFLLNILENPDGLGKVKEPHIVRAEAIEILNMLEKDRVQGNTAHQLLKKQKKWQKIYRHESTDVVMSMSTEDPFLRRLFPEADRMMREHMRMNPRNSSMV